MTFEQIVTEICEELNIIGSESVIQTGRLVDQAYKRLLSEAGMQRSVRAYAISGSTSDSHSRITFSGLWRVTRIYYLDEDDQKVFPEEVTFDELRDKTPIVSDGIAKWAPYRQDADSVTVYVDTIPETVFTVYADGYEEPTDLEDDDEPLFPSGFHDILMDDVLRRMYRARGKKFESNDTRDSRQQRLGELRLWYAKSLRGDFRQGKLAGQTIRNTGGGGAAAASSGLSEITASRLLGRGADNGTGTAEQITLGTDLEMVGTELSLSGVLTGGLTFPATQVPSADANTLDDYEEGAWTPSLTGGGGGSGQTYSLQSGRYTKIGKHVTCWGRITLTALGTVTGSALIAGLPFTSSNTVPFAGSVAFYGSLTATLVNMTVFVNANSISASLYGATAAATGLTALVQATFSNTSDIIFSFSYEADA